VTIRAVVYSPIKLFAEGVAKCLADAIEIETLPWSSLETLQGLLARVSPEILLFDVTQDACVRTARPIIAAHPDTRAIALALPEVLDKVIASAEIGFRSYVPREASVSALCDVVDRALREEVVCDPAVACGLLRELQRRATWPADAEVAVLTPREQEVFGHMSRGLSNKEIARKLGVSAATVKNHVHNILGKTRLRNRVETRVAPRLTTFALPDAVVDPVFARKAS
jgi:two-component system nitrate/nitrite response regulator NarL